MTELKDEELNKVNGGGGGKLPPEGITFSNYYDFESNCYYSKNKDLNNVAYMYRVADTSKYTLERFIVDTASGKWISTSISGEYQVYGIFRNEFPYKLNVRP